MESDLLKKEAPVAAAVSLIILIGFYFLYISGMSLDYIVGLNAQIPQKMIVSQSSFSASGFLFDTLGPVIVSLLAFAIFSFSLAILTVKPLGKSRYFLILPILLSGFLFNFSILFLFFALGLFISCLYVIPLGETYFQELKKWKHFRVGSNSVGKAFLILFLFIFLGSFIALSTNESYKNSFYKDMKGSISVLVQNEVGNAMENYQDSMMGGQAISDLMVQARNDNPNLSEEQYKQMELQIRENLEKEKQAAYNASQGKINALMESSLDNSPLVNSLLFWFPLLTSFTIWAFLELFRGVIFSPLAGVFSFILFHFFDFIEKDSKYFSDDHKVSELERKVRGPRSYNP